MRSLIFFNQVSFNIYYTNNQSKKTKTLIPVLIKTKLGWNVFCNISAEVFTVSGSIWIEPGNGQHAIQINKRLILESSKVLR